jgi:hypothetical protein
MLVLVLFFSLSVVSSVIPPRQFSAPTANGLVPYTVTMSDTNQSIATRYAMTFVSAAVGTLIQVPNLQCPPLMDLIRPSDPTALALKLKLSLPSTIPSTTAYSPLCLSTAARPLSSYKPLDQDSNSECPLLNSTL